MTSQKQTSLTFINVIIFVNKILIYNLYVILVIELGNSDRGDYNLKVLSQKA